MATATTGAVFFLGTRAHYQVLHQPASQCDVENGNASPDSYTCQDGKITAKTPGTGIDNVDTDNTEMGTGVKRRFSKSTECDRDNDLKPALLNDTDNETPKKPLRRRTMLSYLTSIGRRHGNRNNTDAHQLRRFEALIGCSYRESCRCLDCQSRYFDCDESNEDYSSGGSDCDCDYYPSYEPEEHQSDDDEVFLNNAPNDNTSTDLLIQGQPQGQVKMSTSSDEVDPDELQLEVAAGSPVFLNYLLTHPVTCCIQ